MANDRNRITQYISHHFRLSDVGTLNRTSKSWKCSGFTLIELLMVMAIIGILSTLAIPSYNSYKDKTRSGRAMNEIRTLGTEISGYILDKQANPPDLAAINRANFLDPWKVAYVYAPAAAQEDTFFQRLNTDYDLYSKGKDGQSVDAGGNPANSDDIARSNDGAFVGMRP